MNKLPDTCFIFEPTAKPGAYVKAVRYGESGCFATDYNETDPSKAEALVAHLNQKLGVSKLQAECMLAGSMFGWNTPGADIEKSAIAIAKKNGISVGLKSTPGYGPGFYSSYFSGFGVGPCDSEDAVWAQVVERLALIQPGEVVYGSREFGEVSTANVRCPDGGLGTAIRKSRLEVRNMGEHYEIFTVQRLYLRGTDPRDVIQTRLGYGGETYKYASVAEAKNEVSGYIGDYTQAETESLQQGWDRAVLQRESDREDAEEHSSACRP